MDFIGIPKRNPVHKTQLCTNVLDGSQVGINFNSSAEFQNNLPPNDHIFPFVGGHLFYHMLKAENMRD